MKNPLIFFISILLFFVGCSKSEEDDGRGLIINEFLASNDFCCTDEEGEYDDWVELYNDSNSSIDIGGMYFSDTPNDDKPYLIPNTDSSKTTIPPG